MQGSKITPKLGDSLEGIAGLSIYSYSQLKLIAAKGYTTKSVKGKGTQGKVQRKPGINFQWSLSGCV